MLPPSIARGQLVTRFRGMFRSTGKRGKGWTMGASFGAGAGAVMGTAMGHAAVGARIDGSVTLIRGALIGDQPTMANRATAALMADCPDQVLLRKAAALNSACAMTCGNENTFFKKDK
jgi:hypothetical protein